MAQGASNKISVSHLRLLWFDRFPYTNVVNDKQTKEFKTTMKAFGAVHKSLANRASPDAEIKPHSYFLCKPSSTFV